MRKLTIVTVLMALAFVVGCSNQTNTDQNSNLSTTNNPSPAVNQNVNVYGPTTSSSSKNLNTTSADSRATTNGMPSTESTPKPTVTNNRTVNINRISTHALDKSSESNVAAPLPNKVVVPKANSMRISTKTSATPKP